MIETFLNSYVPRDEKESTAVFDTISTTKCRNPSTKAVRIV